VEKVMIQNEKVKCKELKKFSKTVKMLENWLRT